MIQTRKIVSRDDAKATLEPYASTLEDALRSSFAWLQELLDENPSRRVTFDASIQAAMMYRKFVELLEAALIGDAGVKITRKGCMVMFTFGRLVRLRFKKLGSDLTSSNVRTKHQEGIYYQLRLPGLDDDLTDVTFGYLLDRIGTKIVGIYVTCPKNWKVNHWRIEFEDPMMGSSLFITPPAPALPAESIPAVRPKKVSRKAEGA